MASDVDICNQALANIGHTQFLDALDEESDEAEICNRLFAPTRDEILRDFKWPFATRRFKPAALDATTLALGVVPSPWTYAYSYPDGVLRIWSIFSGLVRDRIDQEIGFDIENDANKGTIIVTDQALAELLATVQITDSTKFPIDFNEALAWKLATKLALSIRKDPKMAQAAAGAYREAVARSRANAKTEINQGVEPKPAHITARG